MTQSRLAPSNPKPPPAAIWPDARVEALTQAWRDGLSARQIAAQLGAGLTRSAVIGKLHRLGVCGGRKPSAPRAGVSLSPPLKVAKPDPAALAPRWPDAIPEAPPISPASGAPPCGPGPKYLRDMAPRECRFGLGDPGPGNGAFQLFCAAPTTGHAYCAHHRAIALLPPRSLLEQKVINAADQALVAAVDGARRAVRRCRSGDTP